MLTFVRIALLFVFVSVSVETGGIVKADGLLRCGAALAILPKFATRAAHVRSHRFIAHFVAVQLKAHGPERKRSVQTLSLHSAIIKKQSRRIEGSSALLFHKERIVCSLFIYEHTIQQKRRFCHCPQKWAKIPHIWVRKG